MTELSPGIYPVWTPFNSYEAAGILMNAFTADNERASHMGQEISVDGIEVYIGSGNVFADLGLPDAEELQLKSDLGIEIRLAIKEKRLSRQQAAQKMGLGKEELIKLLNGSPFDYSIEQLINFLDKLDRDVKLSASVLKRRPKTVCKTVAMV